MLPLGVRVDLGAMAVKGYSTLPKDPEQEPHHQMQFSVIYPGHSLGGGFLPLCRDAVGVFSRLSSAQFYLKGTDNKFTI